MPANAGIQQAIDEIVDSRLRVMTMRPAAIPTAISTESPIGPCNPKMKKTIPF
jgi:hypothetical protein